jgi:hypothetical protein
VKWATWYKNMKIDCHVPAPTPIDPGHRCEIGCACNVGVLGYCDLTCCITPKKVQHDNVLLEIKDWEWALGFSLLFCAAVGTKLRNKRRKGQQNDDVHSILTEYSEPLINHISDPQHFTSGAAATPHQHQQSGGGGSSDLHCSACGNLIVSKDEKEEGGYHAGGGLSAWLFASAPGARRLSAQKEHKHISGTFTTQDVCCTGCDRKVGFEYIETSSDYGQYKVGKFCLHVDSNEDPTCVPAA